MGGTAECFRAHKNFLNVNGMSYAVREFLTQKIQLATVVDGELKFSG